MSIKCSLLGHSFGETTVEREREEEGTEVVITITEMETCSRCGETRVVSENKEVTTLETPEGGADEFEATPGDDEADDDGVEGDAAETAGSEDIDTSEATDAVILDDDGSDESSAQAEARGGEPTIPDAEEGAAEVTDEEDDAVIIGDDSDDSGADEGLGGDEDADEDLGSEDAGEAVDEDEAAGDEEDDREPGEWPEEPADPAERAGETAEVEILGDSSDDAADDEPAEPAAHAGAEPDAAPDLGVDTETAGAADAASDAETADDGGDVGAWPEEEAPSTGADAMGDWPEETKRDEGADSSAAGPSLDGEESPSITVPEGTFKCSECGFSTEADETSLRAGDFCPECHRGTLLEHADTVSEE